MENIITPYEDEAAALRDKIIDLYLNVKVRQN